MLTGIRIRLFHFHADPDPASQNDAGSYLQYCVHSILLQQYRARYRYPYSIAVVPLSKEVRKVLTDLAQSQCYESVVGLLFLRIWS
jgi:hypothetical protein